MKVFDSPEVIETTVNRYFDKREKVGSSSTRSTPTKIKRRKFCEDSTNGRVLEDAKIAMATDIMSDLMQSTTLKIRNARYQIKMTLHRLLTFVLDLIHGLGCVGRARSKGVSMECEEAGIEEEGLLKFGEVPVPAL